MFINTYINDKFTPEDVYFAKYLFKENPENDYFLKIKKNPSKIIKNLEYANTLKKISEDYRNFYSGKIASDIVRKITINHKPGDMT